MVVKVFRTNVDDVIYANRLVDQIHNRFKEYKVNFDLDDCDRILRVECSKGVIGISSLIEFLEDSGCHAEILSDVYRPFDRMESPENV